MKTLNSHFSNENISPVKLTEIFKKSLNGLCWKLLNLLTLYTAKPVKLHEHDAKIYLKQYFEFLQKILKEKGREKNIKTNRKKLQKVFITIYFNYRTSSYALVIFLV